MRVWIVLFGIGTLLILFSAVALTKTYRARKLHPDAVAVLPVPLLWVVFALGVTLEIGGGIMWAKTPMPPVTLHGGSFRAKTHRGTPLWTQSSDGINYTTMMPLNGSSQEYLTIVAATADDGSSSVRMPPISVQGDWRIDFYYDDGLGVPDLTTELRACTAADCTLTNASTTGVIYLKGEHSSGNGTNGEFSDFPFEWFGVRYNVNQCRNDKPSCDQGRRNHFHTMILTTAGGSSTTFYCPKGDCKVCVDTQVEVQPLKCD